jgi:hypothetical protein
VVVPLPSPALQLLSPADEVRKETKSGNVQMRKGQGEKLRIQQQKCTWKIYQAGPPWIHNTSFGTLLSEASWSLLGNSGKPVTLATSRFMKFVKYVFRDKELANIWNLKLAKPQSRERVKIWNLEPAKPRSRELVKTRSQEPMKS